MNFLLFGEKCKKMREDWFKNPLLHLKSMEIFRLVCRLFVLLLGSVSGEISHPCDKTGDHLSDRTYREECDHNGEETDDNDIT